MKSNHEKRIQQLEKEVIRLRKLLPPETDKPVIEKPSVVIHHSQIPRIDRRKNSF